MPSISFEDIVGLGDPAPAWRYYCQFPTINGYFISPQAVQRIGLPHASVEVNPTYIAAWAKNYPKDVSVGQLTFTLFEDIIYSAIQYFMVWRSLVVDDSGNYGIPGGPNGYKKDIRVDLLDYTGTSALSLTYIGCYPMGPMEYMLDSETSQVVTTAVNISVDSVKIGGLNTDPIQNPVADFLGGS